MVDVTTLALASALCAGEGSEGPIAASAQAVAARDAASREPATQDAATSMTESAADSGRSRPERDAGGFGPQPEQGGLRPQPEQGGFHPQPDQGGFRLALELDAWFPRLEGDFTDGGPARDAEVDVRSPDLHASEASFAGALAIVRERLAISLRGFSFSTEGSGPAAAAFELGGVPVAAGDAFASDFAWWSAGVEVAYDFWKPLDERPTPWSARRDGWTAPANGTDFAILGLVSADLSGLSRTISNLSTGLATDANESFVALEAGLGMRLGFDTSSRIPVVRRVEFAAKAAGGVELPMGGGDLGSAARVEASLTAWFCHEGAATFGYRLVGGSFDGEDMALDGSLQGLFAGIRIAF